MFFKNHYFSGIFKSVMDKMKENNNYKLTKLTLLIDKHMI